MPDRDKPTMQNPYNEDTNKEIKKPRYNKVDRKNNNTTYSVATSNRKDDRPYNKKKVKNINSF